MIKIKSEEVNFVDDDYYFKEFNWSRVNAIEQMNDFVFLGIGGQENMKNTGKLIIFQENK